MSVDASADAERHVGLARGTRDWLGADCDRIREYERMLLARFVRAGYRPARTPVLELSDLHERKSGAGIVGKLFEVSGAGAAGMCLRPELTAGLVRAYVEADEPPLLPWRASVSGPAFRFQEPGGGSDREFVQTGVELIGAGGPAADAEVVWLADWSLRALGVAAPRIRIGHVGLILELLRGAGLPPAATSALIESLSEAASEGKGVKTLETALDRLTDWLGTDGAEAAAAFASPTGPADPAVDRLFRHLVPNVTGRRAGGDIVGRLRSKWALEHSLRDALANVRGMVRALSDLRGPAAEVLVRLEREFAARAPGSVAAVAETCEMLERLGVDPARIELDLGFGRGIGFYTQMIFELSVDTPEGPVEVCGGGRYDGLARVLGGRDRDDRGAGFAFGLERLDRALSAAAPVAAKSAGGWLVTGDARRAAALATFLRDRVDLPVVVAELEIEPAVALAKSLGLDRIVTAAAEVEVWNVEHGDVRAVREDELVRQIKGRLSLAEGDRR